MTGMLREAGRFTSSAGNELVVFTCDRRWWLVEQVSPGTWSGVLVTDLHEGVKPRVGDAPWQVASGVSWSRLVDIADPVLLSSRPSRYDRMMVEVHRYLMDARERLHDHV